MKKKENNYHFDDLPEEIQMELLNLSKTSNLSIQSLEKAFIIYGYRTREKVIQEKKLLKQSKSSNKIKEENEEVNLLDHAPGIGALDILSGNIL